MRYHITLEDGDGRKLHDGPAINATEAIVTLQSLIKTLRRENLPSFDASWGEQPPAILAPSDEEVAALINSQRNGNGFLL